jgi:hypothetical protein
MSRRKQHRRRILSEDHLNVGARAGGARITYWSGEGPDLANVRPIGDNDLPPLVDFVKDEVIRKLAEAWDVNYENGEIWSVDIEGDTGSLDRRVMIAAPSFAISSVIRSGTSTPTRRSPRRCSSPSLLSAAP